MLHANVRHKSAFVYLSTIVSLLRQGALLNSNCAALFDSFAADASSGQFPFSLLSDRSEQLLRFTVGRPRHFTV